MLISAAGLRLLDRMSEPSVVAAARQPSNPPESPPKPPPAPPPKGEEGDDAVLAGPPHFMPLYRYMALSVQTAKAGCTHNQPKLGCKPVFHGM